MRTGTGDKQRAKEEIKGEEQQDQEKNKEKKVPNYYHPASPVYDPTFKQDPCHAVVQRKNWPWTHTITPPPNYHHNKEEEDASLFIDNLVTSPENMPKEEKGEKNYGEEAEDGRRR